MRLINARSLFLCLTAALFLPACNTLPKVKSSGEYNVPAHRPKNPSAVRVKVSLQNSAVYVMEGDRPLLVTATSIGKPETPTPKGSYTVMEKIQNKRSGSYGFWVSGNNIAPGTSGQCTLPGGRYVGFPMAYWVAWKSGYGLHTGSVWPTPRTHGCLRLHKNVAPKFYALVKMGTPVSIQETQPEDATIGKNLVRPTDYNDPDAPAALLISPAAFTPPTGPLFVD